MIYFKHFCAAMFLVAMLIAISLPATGQVISQTLPNGDFGNGLDHWTVELSPTNASPNGTIEVVNGAAQIHKGGHFLVSLKQGFSAPEGLVALRFRIVQGPFFSGSSGFIPDTFEAHLIRPVGSSAVAVWRAGASSNFNTGPLSEPELGGDTSFDGETVRIDLEAIATGTPLAIVFTFAGPRSFNGGWVAVDDVVLEVMQGPALLAVEPELLDFDEIWPNQTRTMSFEVYNAASEESLSLTLSDLSIAGHEAFQLNGGSCQAGVELQAGGAARCTVEVSFTPTEINAYQATATVSAGDQQAEVELYGQGFLPDDRLFLDRFETSTE